MRSRVRKACLIALLPMALATVPQSAGAVDDEIVVYGSRGGDPIWNLVWWAVINGGNGAGGGIGFGHPNAFKEPGDPPIPIASYGVNEAYEFDMDANGIMEESFEAGFLVRGYDEDSDGIPDVWEWATAVGLAAPAP